MPLHELKVGGNKQADRTVSFVEWLVCGRKARAADRPLSRA